jgi:hypothetical protein
MSRSYEPVFDDIAKYLRFLSKAQSFWLTLNIRYDHCVELCNLMVAKRGNNKARATRKDCGRNNQLKVTGAAMDYSNDR